MRLVLGVDGGATKTVALVADGGGRVLGWGRSGNADIYQTADAEAHVAAAIAESLRSAGAGAADLGAAALSLVGADWPEDFDHWRAALPRLGLPAGTLVVNDALGALAAGAPEGPAVVVALGTGCAVGARGPDGATWHSSFWQRTQGGGELAERALDAAYLAELGLGPATALTALALGHFGARDVEDLLHGFTGRGRSWAAPVASLAPLVLDAAEGGDAVARGLAVAQADAVAGYGRVAAARVGIGAAARLVLAGGVMRHPSRLFPGRIEAAMRRAVPGLLVVPDPPEPAAGAVLLALGAGGAAPGEAARARLRDTLPPAPVFHTGTGEG